MSHRTVVCSSLASLVALVALALPGVASAHEPSRRAPRPRGMASATRAARVERARLHPVRPAPSHTALDRVASRGVLVSLATAPSPGDVFATVSAPSAPATPSTEPAVSTGAGTHAASVRVPTVMSSLRGHRGAHATGYGAWITWEVRDRATSAPRIRPAR